MIEISDTSSFILSLNQNNELHLHSILDGVTLSAFRIQTNQQDTIRLCRIHILGLIICLSEKGELIIYTYNGQLYYKNNQISDEKLNNIEVINPLGSDLVKILVLLLVTHISEGECLHCLYISTFLGLKRPLA